MPQWDTRRCLAVTGRYYAAFAAAVLSLIVLSGCTGPAKPLPTPTLIAPSSATPRPSATPVPPTATLEATAAVPPSPVPTVASLEAVVLPDLLSCNYGPGPDYLYLYALRGGAHIQLIGRTYGDNWHWAYVEGQNRCWVNVSYLQVDGDWHRLPLVYPGMASLPVSPYYAATSITQAVRKGNEVMLEWVDIPLRAGDEEDQFMPHYIIELWHCQGGQMLFEPIAADRATLSFVDEPGCRSQSRARLYLQEKHGFAGPTDVTWPAAH